MVSHDKHSHVTHISKDKKNMWIPNLVTPIQSYIFARKHALTGAAVRAVKGKQVRGLAQNWRKERNYVFQGLGKLYSVSMSVLSLTSKQGNKYECLLDSPLALFTLVCYTAVLRVVTQRSFPRTWGGALRDDSMSGCVADYLHHGSHTFPWIADAYGGIG